MNNSDSFSGKDTESGFNSSDALLQEKLGYKWVNVTNDAPFAPRDGSGALVFKDKMWLLGGWNPGDKEHFPRICNNEVWSSKDGATWILEKPNTFIEANFDSASDWEGRHCAGYVVFQDMMWIIGGDCNQGHYQNDIWNSSDGRKWHLVSDGRNLPWKNRGLFYTVVFDNYIWVMGGQTMPGFVREHSKEEFYNNIWRSRDGVSWENIKTTGSTWSPRGMIGGSVIFKGRIWILGGGTYDTPGYPVRKYYNDVWSSFDGIGWHCHTESAPWAPRLFHDVAVFDGKMWVLEGCHPENSKDVWYSSDGTTWHELPDIPWKPRHAASIFVYDSTLWVTAGNNMESDVWKLK